MRALLVVSLAWLSFAALADVYRWVDKDGVVHYSDKAPTPDAKPAELPQLQTYRPGSPPPLAAEPAKAAAAVPASLSITSPAQEETIRDTDGKFTVTVAAALGNGEGLVYYLDGAAQNSTPTPSQAFLFSGVDRGEHQLAVAQVGADGHEIARSAAVTIFMKQPDVGMSAPKNAPKPPKSH